MTASFSFRPASSENVGLLRRFDQKWIPEPNSGCWLWTGCTNKHGRPFIGLGSATQGSALAYRVSWLLHRGPIPEGMAVCHHCDNPSCVNPDHLFLGSQAENLRDMRQKARQRSVRQPGAALFVRKLTAEDVRDIRASDAPSREICERYGVTSAAIVAVRARKTWRHVL